jgi:16S rRNA processing protein RimM
VPSEEFLLIGKITGLHGIRGGLKVVSYAETPDIFEADVSFLVVDATGQTHTRTIEWVKPHKRGLLFSFHEIQDRDAAETLLQAEIYMKKADLPLLEEDTYYWFELEGLSVVDTDGKYLGRIESIFSTGSNDVYVVKNEAEGAGCELLLPALASVVRSVDLDQGYMTVELPEGL